MLIVDSQVHIWAADTPARRWSPPAHGLKPAPHREVPISGQALLADMQGSDLEWVMGRGVIEWLGWPDLPQST